ncbi:MAG: phosphate starvation-inducible protein PhoH, partial [Porphyromonadaceae bacterium]|nr:phosphate starvation-inducible protein PhoH [Porphyromonadaceae bacterium]
MTERLYILEEVDPSIFIGHNKANLVLLSNLFPKLRLVAHSNVLKVLGEQEETESFLAVVSKLEA